MDSRFRGNDIEEFTFVKSVILTSFVFACGHVALRESVLLTFEIVNFRRDFWHTIIASEAKQSRRDAEIASSLRLLAMTARLVAAMSRCENLYYSHSKS
jgi:hypothetical protein